MSNCKKCTNECNSRAYVEFNEEWGITKIRIEVLHFLPIGIQSFRFTNTGRRYQPKKVVDYKKRLLELLEKERRFEFSELEDCSISVKYWFNFKTPKSWSKKKTEAKMYTGKTSKPDIDNLIKPVQDVIFNDYLKIDDSKIIMSKAHKLNSRLNEIIVEIKINNLGDV